MNKEKLHQILSSLWKNDDSVGKTYYNQALQDIQTAIDLQEESVNKDLEKELDSWRHYYFHGRRDKEASGEYLERVSQLGLAKHFFELGLKVAQKGE